jgi:hypothetical protein
MVIETAGYFDGRKPFRAKAMRRHPGTCVFVFPSQFRNSLIFDMREEIAL